MILNQTIKLLVPSTQGIAKRVHNSEHRERLLEVQNVLSQMFGGSTATRGIGSWFSQENQETVIEDVFIVECKTTVELLNEKLQELYAIVDFYKRDWQQESVALEINGSLEV